MQATLKYNKKSGKDTIEHNVINAQLIVDSINSEQDKEYEHGITNIQNIVFQNLKELSLPFKNIIEIQNLQSLVNLQKLQLDNNLIEKIQNIDHLTQLRWLDLSFNSIEVIEGLDTLTQLEDLSLYDNRITQIQGLDNCQNLNVLSIGNNLLKNYDMIIFNFGFNKQSTQLKFKKLQVLNVAGNPFTKDNESSYRDLIIAHLPGLKYLDYQFIDDNDRAKVREDDKIQNDTVKQEEFFLQMQKDQMAETEQKQELKKKNDARMDMIDNIHDEFFTIPDIVALKPLKPDSIDQLIKQYSDKITVVVKQLQEDIIKKNATQISYVQQFEQAQSERIAMSEKESIKYVKDFERTQKHTFRDIQKIQDVIQKLENGTQDERNKYTELQNTCKEHLNQLLSLLTELKDNMLGEEMQLDDELGQSYQEFYKRVQTFSIDEIIPEITKGQKKIDEIISDFIAKFQEIAKIEIDKYTQNPPQPEHDHDDDENEESERLDILENKDNIQSQIQSAKEIIIEKCSERTQQLETRISQDLKEYSEKRLLMLYERNRKNIQQIHNQIENYDEGIQNRLNDLQYEYDNNL